MPGICLTRREGEAIVIGEARLEVEAIQSNATRLRIEAPKSIEIVREELLALRDPGEPGGLVRFIERSRRGFAVARLVNGATFPNVAEPPFPNLFEAVKRVQQLGPGWCAIFVTDGGLAYVYGGSRRVG